MIPTIYWQPVNQPSCANHNNGVAHRPVNSIMLIDLLLTRVNNHQNDNNEVYSLQRFEHSK